MRPQYYQHHTVGMARTGTDRGSRSQPNFTSSKPNTSPRYPYYFVEPSSALKKG